MRNGTAEKFRRDLTILIILSALYLGLSWFVTNSYYQLILTLVPIWAAFGFPGISCPATAGSCRSAMPASSALAAM